MQYQSTEVLEEKLDEIIGGTVYYYDYCVPLIDVNGIVDWVAVNQSLRLKQLSAIPNTLAMHQALMNIVVMK